MKIKSFLSRVRVSYGYYETICDFCGQHFAVKVDQQTEIEKYLGVFSCTICGGSNPEKKEKKASSIGVVEFSTVPSFSCGWEIEFYIPNPKKDAEYLSLRTPLEKFGWDGLSPLVKERRSDVFYGDSPQKALDGLIEDIATGVKEIEELGGELVGMILPKGSVKPLFFGLHLSFGEDFIDTYSQYYYKKYQPKAARILSILNKGSVKFLYRYLVVDSSRNHRDRVEFRVLPGTFSGVKSAKKLLSTLARELP